jgi:hypothetical protein
MPNFRPADREAFDVVAELITDHFPDLDEAELTYGILFAFPKEGVGTCLARNGYPVATVIKVTSQESRVAARLKGDGLPDVVMKIDGNRWEEWSEEKRAAALDGMLYAIEVQKDKEGVIKEDDAGRPKLKLKPPDFRLEGFASIAERYGEESLEVSTAKAIVDEYGQHLFPFMVAVS